MRKTLPLATLAVALSFPMSEAIAFSSSQSSATAAGLDRAKPPRVLPAIRPGPQNVQCHRGDVSGTRFYDYDGGAWDSPGAGRTAAVALRDYLAKFHWDRKVTKTFERRTLRGVGETAEPVGEALFVGLREDGTVSARAFVERGGRTGHWLIAHIGSCPR